MPPVPIDKAEIISKCCLFTVPAWTASPGWPSGASWKTIRKSARMTRKFSQTDLAHMTGATRGVVNNRLAAMSFDGMVVIKNGWIEIPDLDVLNCEAEREEC